MIPRLLILVLVLAFGVSITGVLVAIQWNDRAAALRESTPSDSTADPRAMAEGETAAPAASQQTASATSVAAAPTVVPEPTEAPATSSTASRATGDESDQPPAFISSDPELRDTYQRARAIYTDPAETEESRQGKIRVLQRNRGEEAVTLVLRYVPVVDLEDGTVQTFDSHMREMADTYDSERGSSMDRDPVGAAMKILFDPSAENIRNMTGIGGSSNSSSASQKEDDDWYEEQERRRREEQRRYEQEQAQQELEESWEDVQDSWQGVEDAVEEASETLSDIINSLGEDR